MSSSHRRALAALLLLVAAVASRASAQATGVPVRNAGLSRGISLSGDVGFGKVQSGTSGTPDRSRAVAAGAGLGLGPLGVTVGVARVTIDPATGANRSTTSGSATAQMTVFGGPLVPLKIIWQAGAARSLDGGSGGPWRGHAGLGAVLAIPATVVSIRPWIAPRLDYLARQPVAGTRAKGAVSAGIDFGLLNGMGLRVSYDSRLGWENGLERASGIGIGASYHFR